ncbi:MAG: HEAT repeat domain-containing protein [Acidimicrobiales bacterium]
MTDTDDVAARRRAVALAGHEGAEPVARAALVDPDPSVRATAIGALERMEQLHEHHLADALRDASVIVRRRACEAVARRPGDGPPSLLDTLADDDTTVVEVAAWASGERTPPEPRVVERLSTLALDHDDALVREAAVAALGAIGDEAGLAAILRATTDKATVRRRAILALAPFDGPEVEAALERARADRDWQVRQAAEDLSD